MAELVVPALGESITEAIIGKWLKQVGDPVGVDEPLVDLETDKITVQLPAPVAGVLSEQLFGEGDTVTVGQVIGSMKPGEVKAKAAASDGGKATNGASSAKPAAKPAAPAPAPAAAAGVQAVATSADHGLDDETLRRLSPSQRKALREHGPNAIPGLPAAPAPTKAPVVAPPAARTATGAELEEVVKMSPLRKRIAQRLVEAQQTAAVLTTFNEVDMGAVMELRSQYKDKFAETHGIKLGFMSFFVKAAVAALKLFPGINAEVREDTIVYKKHYHVGVAVGGGKGLVVPVLRHVDQMSFADVELSIAELAKKAQKNQLSLDDLTGGTFTISNGGIYGSMMSTPLLNLPQTGILGMHNIVKRPMEVNGAVEIRPMMYLALSYDHRVVDGREAVQALVAMKERIENPERLMFDL